MKKSLLIALTVLTTTVSQAATCELERQTVDSLKKQIDAVESRLSWAKTNRGVTAVQGAANLYFAYLLLSRDFGIAPRSESAKIIAVASAATALTGYNLYLTQKEVETYKEMAKATREMLADKEAQIRVGVCVSDQVKESSNQKAQQAYADLIRINQALSADINKLDSELGNIGEQGSTVIGVGASILLVAGSVALNVKNEGAAIFGTLASFIGAAGGGVSQAINLPSLKMSAREARELLEAAKKSQAQLLAQENLLKEILN